jgi:formimidoylglutamate deiminase
VTVDLEDLSIAGNSAEDLLPAIVFGMDRTAVRDVMVGGRFILRDGRHELEDEIVARYKAVHARVWGRA